MQAVVPVADATRSDPFHDLETVIPVTTRQRLLKRAEPWRSSLARCSAGSVARKGTLPGHRRTLAVRSVCRMVRVVAGEMVFLIGDPDASARNQRFALAHIQQISMYVCHVVLQLTMTEIAAAHGRDRTTVGHACARVEDRRDDRAFDQLISAVERVVNALFNPIGTRPH